MGQGVLFGTESLVMSDEDVAKLSPEERLARLDVLLADSTRILDEALEQHLGGRTLAATVVLFSGGNDSTVLAHMMRERATHAAHANTGIGIEQTRQFVRDTCAGWGLPLIEKHPPAGSTYRELVLAQGFPGPAHHWKMYTRLKERCLRQVRRELITKPGRQRVLFLAGRRRSESARRADVVEYERDGSVIWASPLVSWSKIDLNTYRKMNPDCPRNEVSDLLHMSGECLCLAPGSLVATEDGYRPIESITVSDRVLSRQGGLVVSTPVAAVHHNPPKPMLTVKAHFLPAITVTDNHPIWVRDIRYALHGEERPTSEPRYAEAGELHAAHLANQGISASRKRMLEIGRPFRTEEIEANLSEEQLRLLGYFVSEGCYQHKRGHPAGIVFTVGERSRDMATDMADCLASLGVHVGWREYVDARTDRRFIMVRSGRTDVSDFVSSYILGRYSYEKRLSPELMVATTVQQKVLLGAMWDGDGSTFQRMRSGMVNTESAYGTTSKVLALQTQELLLRQGQIYGIHRGRTSTGRDAYLLRSSSPSTFLRGRIEDGVLWSTVASVAEAPAEDTYNLTIAGEPNFLTEGGLVHNCGAFAHPGEREEIRAWFPDVVADIEELEREVVATGLFSEKRCTWGHGGGENEVARNGGMLCSSCEWRGQGALPFETVVH